MKTKILFITGLILFFAYGYSGNGELSKNGSTANNVNIPSLNSNKTSDWKVKSLNLSGELANISSPPAKALYPDISILIPDTVKGNITGNTFLNYIWVDFEIKGNQQINFKNYGGSRIAEDNWGRAFEDNLRNTVKFNISNNELVFKDSLDKPVIVFIPK
ncbi:MAG: hypothetical protein LBG45_00880 [Dysgonamonadaceae bacterium]|nr:hypothetical protein [Dysgonamonadaceae bacterium]